MLTQLTARISTVRGYCNKFRPRGTAVRPCIRYESRSTEGIYDGPARQASGTIFGKGAWGLRSLPHLFKIGVNQLMIGFRHQTVSCSFCVRGWQLSVIWRVFSAGPARASQNIQVFLSLRIWLCFPGSAVTFIESLSIYFWILSSMMPEPYKVQHGSTHLLSPRIAHGHNLTTS